MNITGLELSEECVRKGKELIVEYKLQTYINVELQDVLDYKPTQQFDFIYTTAAVNPVFNYKILHLSVLSNCRWCFISKFCITCIKECIHLPKEAVRTFVRDGELEKSKERRPIMIVSLHYFRNNEVRVILPELSREVILHEFVRKIDSFITKLSFKNRTPNQPPTLIIKLDMILKGNDRYLLKYFWSDLLVDDVIYLEQLENEGVVNMKLKKKIISHFEGQLKSNNIPSIVFPDLPIVEVETTSSYHFLFS